MESKDFHFKKVCSKVTPHTGIHVYTVMTWRSYSNPEPKCKTGSIIIACTYFSKFYRTGVIPRLLKWRYNSFFPGLNSFTEPSDKAAILTFKGAYQREQRIWVLFKLNCCNTFIKDSKIWWRSPVRLTPEIP